MMSEHNSDCHTNSRIPGMVPRILSPDDAISESAHKAISAIEDIISKDDGGRGMTSLVVTGDLEKAAKVLARTCTSNDFSDGRIPQLVILSGFPCCINFDPPTETDGPPGTLAIARAAIILGYEVTIVTDDCNGAVFRAACGSELSKEGTRLKVDTFPAEQEMTDKDYNRLNDLADKKCDLIIACERAGPAKVRKRTFLYLDILSASCSLHKPLTVFLILFLLKGRFLLYNEGG